MKTRARLGRSRAGDAPGGGGRVEEDLRRRVWGSRPGRAGVVVAAVLVLAVVVGPHLVPYDADALALGDKLDGPGPDHWLGTDQFGRDQLARLLEGGRRSLGAGAVVLVAVMVLSLAVGVTAGICGGAVDAVLMRAVDVLLAFPPLVLALAVVGALGPGFDHLLLALTMSSWAYYARLARVMAASARARPDVVAARLAGIPWRRVVAGHVIPGVAAQLAVVATLSLGDVILGIAALSFLGLGVQPPAAEWGAMLTDSRLYFSTAPWLLAGPALAIFLAVMAANLIGDALRDATDPALGR